MVEPWLQLVDEFVPGSVDRRCAQSREMFACTETGDSTNESECRSPVTSAWAVVRNAIAGLSAYPGTPSPRAQTDRYPGAPAWVAGSPPSSPCTLPPPAAMFGHLEDRGGGRSRNSRHRPVATVRAAPRPLRVARRHLCHLPNFTSR